MKKQKIQVGDVVRLSRDFLRNTGQFTGEAPFWKGPVLRLIPFGSEGRFLAEVGGTFPARDDEETGEQRPWRVLSVNLAIAGMPEVER